MGWIDNLQVGDKVIVVTRSHENTTKYVYRITRVTKASVYVGCMRFRKGNGYRVGDTDYEYTSIVYGSEEKINEIESENHSNLSRTLSDFNFEQLPLEKLQKIMDIIKE